MTKKNQLRHSLVKVLCLNHKDKKSFWAFREEYQIAYKVKDIRMALDLWIQHTKQGYRKESARLHLYIQSCCFSSIKAMKNSFKYAQSQYRTQERFPKESVWGELHSSKRWWCYSGKRTDGESSIYLILGLRKWRHKSRRRVYKYKCYLSQQSIKNITIF